MGGLFDRFDNLDQIKVEDVAKWLKPVPRQVFLENYIANRILYPQAVPITFSDMKMDLAILREAIRLNATVQPQEKNEFLGSSPFINATMRKIIIPASFLEFAPDLPSLVWAFIDGLLVSRPKEDWFGDLWTVILSADTDNIIGSILLPQFKSENDIIEVTLDGKTSKIKAGSLTVLPCLKERCSIGYSLSQGKLLGKDKSAIELYGGKLGLVIDGRLF